MIPKAIKLIAACFLLLICTMMNGPGIQAQQVIATSGNYHENAAGSIAYTIGEPVTETFVNTGNIVTSGMQQVIMLPGDICNIAIPLTLPVIGLSNSTAPYEDDYNISPCSPLSNYMDGNDVVYTITLIQSGYLTGDITGAYGSIHVLDACPETVMDSTHCFAFAAGPTGGSFTDVPIPAGTYYVIVSTWAPPQTVDFVMNLSFSVTIGIDENFPLSGFRVYPNPTNGFLTLNYQNDKPTDLKIDLLNILGQNVYHKNLFSICNYSDEIDLSHLTNGIYFVKLATINKMQTIKIIKQ